MKSIDSVVIKSGYAMIVACFLALLINNSSWSSIYQSIENIPIVFNFGVNLIDKTFLVFVNEGLMALFFFLIGLEIKESYLEGPLRNPNKVLLPIFAAAGGMIVPALIYYFFNMNEPLYIKGWAIPMATDIAFSLAIYSMVNFDFPEELRMYLTTLAIVDDIGAVLVIGLFYTDYISFFWLTIAFGWFITLIFLKFKKIENTSLYLLIGLFFWYAILFTGFHATLAGVIVALFIPMKNRKGEEPLRNLIKKLLPWVYYLILPVFAFMNCGVKFYDISTYEILNNCSLGIFFGLFIGKPLGVMFFSWLSIKLGYVVLSKQVNWKMICGMGCLTGIGFTMSLFITSISFENDLTTLMSARFGILLASFFSGVMGYYLFSLCRREKVNLSLSQLKSK
ncbi:MAG: Na+/H+ antiporter NhaA [Legionellales bacterium]|nr:Na+/H+ antiporter NhaA [Legionellales bacterium]